MATTATEARFTALPDEETLAATTVALEEHGFSVEVVDDLDAARRAVLDRIPKGASVMHDTMNEMVRAGLESVRYEAYPKVAYVELDLVAGYMFREPALLHELWGGLGLVVVDSTRDAYFSDAVRQRFYHDNFVDLMGERMLALEPAA